MQQLKEMDSIKDHPTRQALAQAISRLEVARKQATTAQSIYARCDGSRWDAHAAVESAESGLALARNDAIDSVSTGREFLSTKAARERLDDATDRLQAIEASEPRLKKVAEDAAGEVPNAQRAVQDAIATIFASSPGVTRLVAECERARKTLIGANRIREVFSARNMTPAQMMGLELWSGAPIDATAEMAWRQAIDALERDPFAPLPE